jgi:hypothetical protein
MGIIGLVFVHDHVFLLIIILYYSQNVNTFSSSKPIGGPKFCMSFTYGIMP